MDRLRGVLFQAVAGCALALLAALAVAADAPPKEAPPKKDQSKPAPPGAAPLKFTDDDLEKYKKPAAGDPDSTDDEAMDDEEATAKEPPAAAAPAPPKPPAPRPAPPRPLVRAKPKPPVEDPLKPWKERDAMAAMRQEQIRGLREKIVTLQTRLDYLNAKKGAISNPNPVQVGDTGPRAFQYDENGNPVVYADGPNKGKPVTTPDLSPGRNQPKMLPIFPALPEPQTDQDREDDKRMKSKALLEKVEEELKTVQEEMDQAKRDLIGIETRFAQETGSR